MLLSIIREKKHASVTHTILMSEQPWGFALKIPRKFFNPLQTSFSLFSPTFAANVSRGGIWRHSFSLPDSLYRYRSQFLEASLAANASLWIALDSHLRRAGRYIDRKMICECQRRRYCTMVLFSCACISKRRQASLKCNSKRYCAFYIYACYFIHMYMTFSL